MKINTWLKISGGVNTAARIKKPKYIIFLNDFKTFKLTIENFTKT
jgi:hypothetical protein